MLDAGQILDAIKDHYLAYGYLILIIATYIEYVILAGLIWPGGTLILLGVVYSIDGQLSFPLVVGAVWLGAALGNATNYWLGYIGALRLITGNRFYPYIKPYMDRAHHFMTKFGRRSIFFSQFIGAVRPFVCLLAGSVKMPARQFFLYQLPAVLLWNIIFCGAGYLLAKSVNNIETLVSGFGVAVVTIMVLVWLGYRLVVRRRRKTLSTEEITSGVSITSEEERESFEQSEKTGFKL